METDRKGGCGGKAEAGCQYHVFIFLLTSCQGAGEKTHTESINLPICPLFHSCKFFLTIILQLSFTTQVHVRLWFVCTLLPYSCYILYLGFSVAEFLLSVVGFCLIFLFAFSSPLDILMSRIDTDHFLTRLCPCRPMHQLPSINWSYTPVFITYKYFHSLKMESTTLRLWFILTPY